MVGEDLCYGIAMGVAVLKPKKSTGRQNVLIRFPGLDHPYVLNVACASFFVTWFLDR